MLCFIRTFFLFVFCLFVGIIGSRVYGANGAEPVSNENNIKRHHEIVKDSICNAVKSTYGSEGYLNRFVFYDNQTLNEKIQGMKEFKFFEDQLLRALVFFTPGSEYAMEEDDGCEQFISEFGEKMKACGLIFECVNWYSKKRIFVYCKTPCIESESKSKEYPKKKRGNKKEESGVMERKVAEIILTPSDTVIIDTDLALTLSEKETEPLTFTGDDNYRWLTPLGHLSLECAEYKRIAAALSTTDCIYNHQECFYDYIYNIQNLEEEMNGVFDDFCLFSILHQRACLFEESLCDNGRNKGFGRVIAKFKKIVKPCLDIMTEFVNENFCNSSWDCFRAYEKVPYRGDRESGEEKDDDEEEELLTEKTDQFVKNEVIEKNKSEDYKSDDKNKYEDYKPGDENNSDDKRVEKPIEEVNSLTLSLGQLRISSNNEDSRKWVVKKVKGSSARSFNKKSFSLEGDFPRIPYKIKKSFIEKTVKGHLSDSRKLTAGVKKEKHEKTKKGKKQKAAATAVKVGKKATSWPQDEMQADVRGNLWKKLRGKEWPLLVFFGTVAIAVGCQASDLFDFTFDEFLYQGVDFTVELVKNLPCFMPLMMTLASIQYVYSGKKKKKKNRLAEYALCASFSLLIAQFGYAGIDQYLSSRQQQIKNEVVLMRGFFPKYINNYSSHDGGKLSLAFDEDTPAECRLLDGYSAMDAFSDKQIHRWYRQIMNDKNLAMAMGKAHDLMRVKGLHPLLREVFSLCGLDEQGHADVTCMLYMLYRKDDKKTYGQLSYMMNHNLSDYLQQFVSFYDHCMAVHPCKMIQKKKEGEGAENEYNIRYAELYACPIHNDKPICTHACLRGKGECRKTTVTIPIAGTIAKGKYNLFKLNSMGWLRVGNKAGYTLYSGRTVSVDNIDNTGFYMFNPTSEVGSLPMFLLLNKGKVEEVCYFKKK